MDKKVIAIGNRMMGDDGIALAVAEKLEDFLLKEGIEVVMGETDFAYCLEAIRSGDFIIILDASYNGWEPGTVRLMPIEEAMVKCRKYNSQHESNLLFWLNIYGIEIKGTLLTIEACTVEPNWGLSQVLESILTEVCEKVKDKIIYILGEGHYA